MKIKCDFCKTEYTIDRVPNTPVKCAVCGHTWAVSKPSRRGAIMMFVAAACALLSAIVFVIAVVVSNRMDDVANRPLVAEISEIKTITDKDGTPHYVVRGAVVNRTMQIYSVPDLVIVSLDAAGKPVAKQKFLPSVPLLDAGGTVEFNYTLSGNTDGVKKITVELQTGDM
ncbi:MAG: hypothetical protein J5679_03325 [Alphaproteobacteria bacterium]|nr:hypothetical protein [Alphaproteobacteria bacterium]